jgi:hypothetical protein
MEIKLKVHECEESNKFKEILENITFPFLL